MNGPYIPYNFFVSYLDIFVKKQAYPNLSTAIGGDEGGVCIGPAIVVMANGDGQWCCCCVCCWWPAVSPLILSGGVSVPGIIPLPTYLFGYPYFASDPCQSEMKKKMKFNCGIQDLRNIIALSKKNLF